MIVVGKDVFVYANPPNSNPEGNNVSCEVEEVKKGLKKKLHYQ